MNSTFWGGGFSFLGDGFPFLGRGFHCLGRWILLLQGSPVPTVYKGTPLNWEIPDANADADPDADAKYFAYINLATKSAACARVLHKISFDQGLPHFAFRVRIRTLSGRETRNAIISRCECTSPLWAGANVLHWDSFDFGVRPETRNAISRFVRKRRPDASAIGTRNAKRDYFAFRSRGLNLT